MEGSSTSKHRVSSEFGLLMGLLLTSLSVCLFLKSGLGVTVISSVPLEIHYAIPSLAYGEWNIIYHFALMGITCLTVRHFKIGYVASIGLAVAYGFLIDIEQPLVNALPDSMALDLIYFVVSMITLSFGIAFYMRCGLPLLPADMLIRDTVLTYKIPFKRMKTLFDVSCLVISVSICFLVLGGLRDIGLGTVISALTTGWITSYVLRAYDSFLEFSPAFGIVRRFMEMSPDPVDVSPTDAPSTNVDDQRNRIS